MNQSRNRVASPAPVKKVSSDPISEKNGNEPHDIVDAIATGKGYYAEARCPTAKIYEKPEVTLSNGKKQGNIVRRKTDYCWIAVIYCIYFLLSQMAWPGHYCNTPNDRQHLVLALNLSFGFADPLGQDYWKVFACYTIQACLSVPILTLAAFIFMYIVNKQKTYTPTIWKQLPGICVNTALMIPVSDSLCTYLCCKGWGKMFTVEPPYNAGEHAILYHVRDILLWLAVFELTWYVQHRAMHDNKFLWKFGHEYHHQWRKPEHMIGITNWAFDHIVEVWVTLSSSYIPLLFFPIHLWAFRFIGFSYMVLAMFVHWDAFPMRTHLNHHYLVIKNYGSHILIYDWLFGTYQPGSYFPANEDEKYPSFKPIARTNGHATKA